MYVEDEGGVYIEMTDEEEIQHWYWTWKQIGN